jgi:probable phosphoglycerate mutase
MALSAPKTIRAGPLAGAEGIVIYFVRHGEPEDHDDDPGVDPPLTPRGRRQTARLARRLAGESFDHVYVSDLARAYETGEIILRRHPSAPVTISRALREVAGYHFAGSAVHPGADAPAADGERAALDAFVSHVRAVHRPGQRILVVAHGNLIRALVCLLACHEPSHGLIIDLHNAALTVLEILPGGRAVLRVSNCTRHIPARDVT